jgi:hypothetical protein
MRNAKLLELLWVIVSVITLSLILFNHTGSGILIAFAVVSCLSLICWFRFSYQQTPGQNLVMPLYILSITVLLVLNTIRFSSNYASFIQVNYPGLFKPSFTLNHTNWFILMVCFPVSAMLLGGYFLGNRKPVGFYFAWWGFFFCMAESIIQFKVELGNINSYTHHYFLGALTAMGLFLVSAYGIIKLIKPVIDHRPLPASDEGVQRKINLWSILFVTLVIVYGVTLYTQAGILPVGVIAGSMMGGMIGWRKTTARQPADPYKLVPLYLLLQALFYIHVGEEMATHFNQEIASISGHPWSDTANTYLIAFIGPMIWVFAAWSLWKGQAFGNFILWFMIVGMILGEPTHLLVFPIVRMVQKGVGYEYFSGMYTALFPMVPAIMALTVIIKDTKARKEALA